MTSESQPKRAASASEPTTPEGALPTRILKYRARWWRMRHHPVQQALRQCVKEGKRSRLCVLAGRQSGKTELAFRCLVQRATVVRREKPPRYAYCAPTQGHAMELGWDNLCALLWPLSIESLRRSDPPYIQIKDGDGYSGARIYVLGLDARQRLEGPGWDGIVVDETSDVHPDAIRLSIWPALTQKRGWLWLTGVPKRDGIGAEFYQEQCERARLRMADPDAEEAFFTWPSWDIMAEEQLKWYRENMDEADFQEQFGGVWQSAGGDVFHAFSPTVDAGNVRACHYRPDLPVLVGSDFNVAPMAWVVAHYYAGEGGAPGRLEQFDELWLSHGATTQAALDALWGRYGATAKAGFRFYGDATARSDHTSTASSDYVQIVNDARFRAAGCSVHYPPSNPGVANRFAACNALFCSASGVRRYGVDPRCKHTIYDLQHRVYRAGTRVPDDRGRAGTIGHISDALGYLVWMLFPPVRESAGTPSIIRTSLRGRRVG